MMFFGKFNELRQPRHRAVVVHDFTNYAYWLQTGHCCEIDCRLRVTCATEHTAILRDQWKDMARLHEIARLAHEADENLDGARAIRRTDAGGDALGGVHTDREICLKSVARALHHRVESQMLRAILSDRHANEAACVLGHEVHHLRRGTLRRADEIALVLAVGVIRDDDHLARADVGEDGFDIGEWGVGGHGG